MQYHGSVKKIEICADRHVDADVNGFITLPVWIEPGPEQMGCMILCGNFHITHEPGQSCDLLFSSQSLVRF